jgi:hypothetical protein
MPVRAVISGGMGISGSTRVWKLPTTSPRGLDGADLGDVVAGGGAAGGLEVEDDGLDVDPRGAEVVQACLGGGRGGGSRAGSSRRRLTTHETLLVPSRQGWLYSLVHLTSVERGR